MFATGYPPDKILSLSNKSKLGKGQWGVGETRFPLVPGSPLASIRVCTLTGLGSDGTYFFSSSSAHFEADELIIDDYGQWAWCSKACD